MKKSKLILGILLIIFLSALLTGCGDAMDFILGGWVESCCGGFAPLPIAAICLKLLF